MTMSENAKQSQIRQGLKQYIGAVLTNSDFTPQENRHLAVAMLCEEALKIITHKDDNGDDLYIDDYVCKPFLRGFQYLMLRNVERIKNESPPDFQSALNQYISLCENFNRNVLASWIDSEGSK